ncbi:hypothetical protein RchiOBHm_Chr4g0393611 [Rosa chinensis]|uniref:Dymeclin n=1 Tax=Rosa chinensis TaxID=74649 RepID=A0A2P6QR42_ROSCH|nr:hypothetical protein RchiOBHm_Chr4g0393611 [Rosa chinensis]
MQQCLRLLDKNVLLKGSRYLSDNPYCKALEHATDVEFDRVDTEGNGRSGPVLRYLTDEAAALLLYSLLQGNADYLECVLVRTDLDTLVFDAHPGSVI